MMKHSAALAAAVFTLLLAISSWAGKPLQVGDKAPNWILYNGTGQDISLYQDSANQPAVILFWATWCDKCAELMPELQTLQESFKASGVKFYALNVWEDGDPQQFMAEHDFDFTLLMEADFVAKRYGVKGTPGLLVVDRDKVIRYSRHKGTSSTEAAALVKQALMEEVQ